MLTSPRYSRRGTVTSQATTTRYRLQTVVCCKLLEHIVCSHIREHLDVNNVLSRFQHGFCKGHSCESQLLLTVNDLAAYHDRKVQVDIAVLDFSKAFDVVPHKSLMRKLTHYGIGGNVHNWIGSFLMERQQQVIIDGEQSMKVHMDSGVPQGTVMGPLLFLLYINDLPGHVTSTVRLFADDCLLYRPLIRTPDDQVKLQQDLHALTTWATIWGMKFNPSKCHILTMCKNVRLPVQIYSLCECALSHVPDTRYLEEDLHWHKHINSLTANASRTLGFLRRNLRDCPRELKQLAYFSLVRSRLEYASVAWDPYMAVVDIDALERVQGRGARFVCGNYRRDSREASVTKMLEELGWESLQERRLHQRLTMMSHIIGGRVAIPAEHLIASTTRTRSQNSAKFRQIGTKTLIYKNVFFPRTIPEWNNTTNKCIAELLTRSQWMEHAHPLPRKNTLIEYYTY